MSDPVSSLRITRIVLPAHLGWGTDERSATQPIEIELELRFASLPRACATDQLAGTVDYGALVSRIGAAVAAKEYRLLEHLGKALYDTLREALPEGSRLALTVAKWPPQAEVEGLASFRVADWE